MSAWEQWQQCPCPECNGAGPRWLDAPDEREELFEPEHPENLCPKPVSFWFYADVLK